MKSEIIVQSLVPDINSLLVSALNYYCSLSPKTVAKTNCFVTISPSRCKGVRLAAQVSDIKH
ncbi:hypothetical protein [Phoenicibacter congonensis]|uniref:hypothetical protein n=1 Tax=Phoenicibacter congonensis TaxID=1944646 RepID=UPI0009A56419|nr:hypothetical protein [Phoenicibacter congonensis]